ncbi:hypothetical protein ABT126_43525 [Streptomyces sp. NPDC002012]|uniref:hypothetical protein n=1 Tax=Streptomyces sp. NPDC002012 TaxID=3154532 RepID=UPI00331F27AB
MFQNPTVPLAPMTPDAAISASAAPAPRVALSLDRVRYVRHTAHLDRGEISVPAHCATAGEKALPPRACRWETAGMTTQRLPFPVPDERAHNFVNSYADMHDLVEDLVVPTGVPEAAATVLRTARELLRQSYYCYEFSTVAVMHSLIAVGIVLRDRIPGAGKKPLQKLIQQGADAGTLTARQAEYLDYGRQIRNGMAHGKTTHAVMPSAMAVPMVTTSFAIVSELCAAPA